MTSGGLVVALEGAAKRVLSRRKLYRNQFYEMFRSSGSAEKVTNLSHRSHQIGTFGEFSWRMKKFVSFRIVATAAVFGCRAKERHPQKRIASFNQIRIRLS
jgi:hypothetical protein